MSRSSSARGLRLLAWLLVASLICAAFAPVAALAQAGQPGSAADPTGSAAQPEQLPDPGIAAPVSNVEMILLPWSDTSIRVAPPEQFLRMNAAEATAPATFQISYLPAGASQLGYSCLAWPTAAQTAFSYAASIWASLVTSPVPIRINACWTNMGSTSILGSSSSYSVANFPGAPQPNTMYSFSLADKFGGTDLYTQYPDSYINYNSTFSWYFGTDGNTPAGQVDFASVALHEIGHSLNFSGFMRYGSTYCGGANYGCWGSNGYPGIYDRFTENGAGQALLDTAVFPNNSAALGAQLTSSNLFFDGPNANAANGGNRVKIYAPTSWSQGSSYAHLDYSTFRYTDHKLMVYAIPSGAAIHDPGSVTLGLLSDLGWANSVTQFLSIDNVSVTEGNSGTTAANFTVSLPAPASSPVTVNWATANGSATAGSDYVADSGAVSFAAGEQSKSVPVTINGDTAVEGNETFFVNLSNASGATIADGQGVGTITNDDSDPCYTLTTSATGQGEIRVEPAPNCNSGAQYAPGSVVELTATAGAGYTFSGWTGDLSGTTNPATITMNGNKTVGATFAAQTYTLTINQSTGGTIAASPTGPYQYGQVVTLTAMPNTGYNFTGWAGALSGTTNPATITMNGNKTVGATFQTTVFMPAISISDVSLTEGNKGSKTFSFTITLFAPASGTVTVNWATVNGTATGKDYTAASGTTTFSADSASRTVTVQVNGDRSRESNETFFVNLAGAAGATIADGQGRGTILNDD